MGEIVSWKELYAVIEPYYPKGQGCRPIIVQERMLRMLFVQHCFNLAYEACKKAPDDSVSLRSFVSIDLGFERVPNATTILKFRPLETDSLGEKLFAEVGEVLQGRSLKMGTGTV